MILEYTTDVYRLQSILYNILPSPPLHNHLYIRGPITFLHIFYHSSRNTVFIDGFCLYSRLDSRGVQIHGRNYWFGFR